MNAWAMPETALDISMTTTQRPALPPARAWPSQPVRSRSTERLQCDTSSLHPAYDIKPPFSSAAELDCIRPLPAAAKFIRFLPCSPVHLGSVSFCFIFSFAPVALLSIDSTRLFQPARGDNARMKTECPRRGMHFASRPPKLSLLAK